MLSNRLYSDGVIDYYTAYIISVSDYSPFGVELANRSWSIEEYRNGFQKQEKDKELWEGAMYYKYRVEDPRLGRFFSVDPLYAKYPYNSNYAFSENRVIDGVELEGLEVLQINHYPDAEGQMCIKYVGVFHECNEWSIRDVYFDGNGKEVKRIDYKVDYNRFKQEYKNITKYDSHKTEDKKTIEDQKWKEYIRSNNSGGFGVVVVNRDILQNPPEKYETVMGTFAIETEIGKTQIMATCADPNGQSEDYYGISAQVFAETSEFQQTLSYKSPGNYVSLSMGYKTAGAGVGAGAGIGYNQKTNSIEVFVEGCFAEYIGLEFEGKISIPMP